MAVSPLSPVLIRITSSTGDMKILPSPMYPVWPFLTMISTICSTFSSLATISIYTLGRRSTL